MKPYPITKKTTTQSPETKVENKHKSQSVKSLPYLIVTNDNEHLQKSNNYG
jgi:hypothetical protein